MFEKKKLRTKIFLEVFWKTKIFNEKSQFFEQNIEGFCCDIAVKYTKSPKYIILLQIWVDPPEQNARYFVQKTEFSKNIFFEPGFCMSYQASNICTGLGCLLSDISREKNPPRSANFIGFEHFWQKSLRECYQKIRRILGFSRNSSDFDDLYLRAQGELEARTTCVRKAWTWSSRKIKKFEKIFSQKKVVIK